MMTKTFAHLLLHFYDLPDITPTGGGPGVAAAQQLAGQLLLLFLIVAGIGLIICAFVAVFSHKSHNSGGMKGALTWGASIIGAVIIASSAAQIINWGQAIPLFG